MELFGVAGCRLAKNMRMVKLNHFPNIGMYIPGTQMTLVLNGKGLLLEGSNPKIEDKRVPGT